MVCISITWASDDIYATQKEKLKYVYQYNGHGERTPLFPQGSEFDKTKNIYNQGPNELTIKGLRNSFMQGENFKDEFLNRHGGFLAPGYIPSDFFVRANNDHPSIMSAYAFIMGMDYEEVDGLGLIEEEKGKSPISTKMIDQTRTDLSVGPASKYAKAAYIHAGNSDGFFFNDIQSMYPGLVPEFEHNLELAYKEFKEKNGDTLFHAIADMLKMNRDDIDFYNLSTYLDDYMSAYSNDKPLDPFLLDDNLEELIKDYYYHLIKRGMLRDENLNRVVAHPFLYSLLRDFLFKAQDPSALQHWDGPCVSSKVSLAFGSRLTYLAVLNVLGVGEKVNYLPGWGDQLTFELSQEGPNWFVRTFDNDDQVFLKRGIGKMPLDDFNEFICPRLYYGDMNLVKNGLEDYREKAQIRSLKCDSIKDSIPLFGCRKILGYQREHMDENSGVQDGYRTNYDQKSVQIGGNLDNYAYYVQKEPVVSRNLQAFYTYTWEEDANSNTQPTSQTSYSNSQYGTTSSSGGSYTGGSSSSNSYSTTSTNSGGDWSSSSSSTQGSQTQNMNLYRLQSSDDNQSTGRESCPIEYKNSGFKEVGMTEVDVTVKVKKPVTTYVEEEVCQTQKIPTVRRDFNLFRVAPVKVTQVKQRSQDNTNYAAPLSIEKESIHTSNYSPVVQGSSTYTIVDEGKGTVTTYRQNPDGTSQIENQYTIQDSVHNY